MSVDHIYHEKAGSIKKGGYLLVNGQPCRIFEVHRAKTGKHGSAKVRFVGLQIFNRRKYEDLMPSTENVEVPEVRKYDLKIVSMSGSSKSVTGVAPDGRRVTLPLPTEKNMQEFVDELTERVRERKPTIAIVAQACGKEGIVALKGFSASSEDDDETHPDYEEEDDGDDSEDDE